jgi:hypothetical protein
LHRFGHDYLQIKYYGQIIAMIRSKSKYYLNILIILIIMLLFETIRTGSHAAVEIACYSCQTMLNHIIRVIAQEEVFGAGADLNTP